MDILYIITPFFAWLITGITKFLVNSAKEKRFAFDLIGYGGFPSNHSSIVSSAAAIIALKEGPDSPALVVALALAFIVILDASSLRQQVGKHARSINKLNIDKQEPSLRERMGHTRIEIFAGILVGIASAYILYKITI